MFRDLEGRSLTVDEESIIAQRVALQRKMADEFDRREKARKVRRHGRPGMRAGPARDQHAGGRTRACARQWHL